jgi:gliding motility-associated protein GldE
LLSGDNLLYIIIAVILVVLAGIISMSESAMFSLTADQLNELRTNRGKKGRKINDLLSNPRLLLSVFTAWKYVTLIACAVIFTIAVNIAEGSGIGIEGLLLTVLFAFVGIILPKIYGSAHNVSIVTTFGSVYAVLVKITKPIVTPLLTVSFKVERKLEILSENSSAKELAQALELAAADKETTEDQKEILRGIVNFGTLTVDEVMRPENEIHGIDVTLNFHDLLLYIRKSGFSRLPAYRETFDHIEGVLYIKDLLPYLTESKKFNWQKLLRPAYFVPQLKKIDLLLKDFQEKRVHMALAIDEFGKVAGIITLEDIIEEIIGDIHDEFDEAGAYYRRIDDKTFVFDSKITVAEFYRILDIDPAVEDTNKDDNETLGGWLVEMQNELPKNGDQIVLDPFTLVIEAIDHKRIKKIRVHIHEQKEQ